MVLISWYQWSIMQWPAPLTHDDVDGAVFMERYGTYVVVPGITKSNSSRNERGQDSEGVAEAHRIEERA